MDDQLVTVVIPAADEERFLPACLESVCAQDYRRLQILVVDGASTDGTAAVVRTAMARDPRVELLHNERRNIPSSLNLALDSARGEWLVRVDAHCTVPPSYVGTAVQALREEDWVGVGGRKDGVGKTPSGRAIALAMSSRLGVGNSTYHHGTERGDVEHLPFGAYPTELLRRVGGWDERLSANEDFELDYRLRQAGHRLLFEPRMSIAWHCRQSVPDLFRQYRRYGRGKADVAWMHPESLSPRHVAPPMFIAYLTASAVVGLWHRSWAAAMVAPYAVALAGESARLAPRLDTAGERLRLPPAFAAMHVGWGLGFWEGVRTNLARPSGQPREDRRA